jgi:hypothetical protein
MTRLPPPLLIDELRPEQLQSNFALELFTQTVASVAPEEFQAAMRWIFGEDIPASIFTQLREELLAGEIANADYVLSDAPQLADYDNRERLIRINPSVISRALAGTEPELLLNILLHEFGHHLDNVLRSDLIQPDPSASPLAADAGGEEGARLALWLACMAKPASPRVQIAIWWDMKQDRPREIAAHWAQSSNAIIRKHIAGLGKPPAPRLDSDREGFEAGDGNEARQTHLEIEKVLRKCGLTPAEVNAVYFGNWLRDYSQLLDPKIVRALDMPKDFPNVLSRDALTRIVDVLSVKRFGGLRRQPGADYKVTPARLGVYRPSEHIDNPKVTDRNAPDPTSRDLDFEVAIMAGSPQLEVDYQTSMKRYISRSVDFMNRELRIAIDKGPNAEGLRAFGSALHVLEDFFAHSNFVELALIKEGYRDVLPWTSPANCRAGLPLVTGMFGPTDVVASLAGPLGEILFSVEDVIYQPIKPGDRSPREQVLLILLEEHHNPRYLEIYNAFLTTRDRWVDLPFAEYLQRCAAYLQGLSAVPGNAVGIIFKEVLSHFGDKVDDWQTVHQQDPHENGSTDPSHSQLAKDHAEHPLHLLAASLATEAVRSVATAMISYWDGNGGGDPIAVAQAYFKHPMDCRWQNREVAAWAAGNPENLRRSQDKVEMLEVRKLIATSAKKASEQMRKDSLAYLNFMRGEFLDSNSPIWLTFRFTPTGSTLHQVLRWLGILK